MPDVGIPELLIILVVLVIVFGIGKLPEVGGALGKGIREFRRESSEDAAPPTAAEPRPADAKPQPDPSRNS